MRARPFICNVFAFLLAFGGLAGTAGAGLTRAEITSIGFNDRSGRALPGDAVTVDAAAGRQTLAERLGGRPALLAFVDYTCRTVCGVAANALAAAESGLRKGGDLDHRILVLGFDARDSAKDRATWLASNPEAGVLGDAAFLLADAPTTSRLVEAAGLRTVYDSERDQFAHPAGALLVDTHGRIVRALDLVSLQPDTLRLALVEASNGTAGSFVERAILSCYGWDAETGRYAPLINGTLMASGAATVLAIAAAVALLLMRERRANGDGRAAGTMPGESVAGGGVGKEGGERA